MALAPNGPGNVDVVELDAASHGGVDDTRELRDRAFYAPAQSRYRIFIVDEAHMVTTAGFNALLKIVEEPPEHLIFVFATTEPDKVLPTIRSRTHHYPFRLLAPKTMRGLLERICAQEGVQVDDAVYPLVIRAGGGSPRDSLSVLDQLVAGADGNRVVYQRALALLGATDVALIDDAVDALAAGDAAALFGAVESVIDAGHDPRRFAVDLLERFRDLIVLQAVPDAADRGVVDAPDDVLERMRQQSGRLGPGTLARCAEVVHAGLGEMRGATAPRLLLEVVCARLLLPSASDTESALLQRIERIETRIELSVPGAAGPASTESSAPAMQFVRASRTARGPRLPRRRPLRNRSPRPRSPHRNRSRAPSPHRNPSPPLSRSPRFSARPSRPEPQPAAAPPPPVKSQPAAGIGQPDAAAVRTMWNTVRDKVKSRSKPVNAMLDDAIVRAVEGNTLVLSHGAPTLVKRLGEPRNSEIIREALKDALGVDWQIRCVAGGSADSATPAAPATGFPARPDREADWEERMLAEASSDTSEMVRRDPEEAAIELLQNELGARRIDPGQ